MRLADFERPVVEACSSEGAPGSPSAGPCPSPPRTRA